MYEFILANKNSAFTSRMNLNLRFELALNWILSLQNFDINGICVQFWKQHVYRTEWLTFLLINPWHTQICLIWRFDEISAVWMNWYVCTCPCMCIRTDINWKPVWLAASWPHFQKAPNGWTCIKHQSWLPLSELLLIMIYHCQSAVVSCRLLNTSEFSHFNVFKYLSPSIYPFAP